MNGPRQRFQARLSSQQGHALLLVIDSPVAGGTPLQVELDDSLLLVEVIQCRRDGNDYHVLTEIAHSLQRTRDLATLAARFLSSW